VNEEQIAKILERQFDKYSLNFASTITRSVDHLIERQEQITKNQEELSKAAAANERRMDRIELIVERVTEQQAETNTFLKETAKTVSEIALNQSNIEHDRRDQGEKLLALHDEISKIKEDIEEDFKKLEGEVSSLTKKMDRIYITVTAVGSIAAVVAWVIHTVLKISKG
jgi:uncharacterized phage infection (PIP) family protein YhgE